MNRAVSWPQLTGLGAGLLAIIRGRAGTGKSTAALSYVTSLLMERSLTTDSLARPETVLFVSPHLPITQVYKALAELGMPPETKGIVVRNRLSSLDAQRYARSSTIVIDEGYSLRFGPVTWEALINASRHGLVVTWDWSQPIPNNLKERAEQVVRISGGQARGTGSYTWDVEIVRTKRGLTLETPAAFTVASPIELGRINELLNDSNRIVERRGI